MTQHYQNNLLLPFMIPLMVGTIASNLVSPANSQSEVPMKLHHAEGTYTIAVLNSSTTKSAYGSCLRFYDVHIAKGWMNFTRQFKPVASAGNAVAPKASFFASVIPQVKRRTSIPVLLPDRLLPPMEERTYFDVRATTNSYNVSIHFTPDCGGATACYIGAVEAQRGGKLTPSADLANSMYKNIRLAKGVKGIFWNACGAYCTAAVEWRSQGILYRVTAKNGEEQPLVQMAISAIAAGPR